MAKKETIEVTVDEALTGIAGQHNKRIQAGQELAKLQYQVSDACANAIILRDAFEALYHSRPVMNEDGRMLCGLAIMCFKFMSAEMLKASEAFDDASALEAVTNGG